MTAIQTTSNNPANSVKFEGLKVKTPNSYKAWEVWINLSTGEVYEEVICEIGDTSEITKPELPDVQYGLKNMRG